MNDTHWASFDVVHPDGEKQTLCCDLGCADAIEQIIDFLFATNAKITRLVNFMVPEVQRLEKAKCRKGQSLFALA